MMVHLLQIKKIITPILNLGYQIDCDSFTVRHVLLFLPSYLGRFHLKASTKRQLSDILIMLDKMQKTKREKKPELGASLSFKVRRHLPE